MWVTRGFIVACVLGTLYFSFRISAPTHKATYNVVQPLDEGRNVEEGLNTDRSVTPTAPNAAAETVELNTDRSVPPTAPNAAAETNELNTDRSVPPTAPNAAAETVELNTSELPVGTVVPPTTKGGGAYFNVQGVQVFLPLETRWNSLLPPSRVPEYRLPANLSTSCAAHGYETRNYSSVSADNQTRRIFLFTTYNGEADWLEVKLDEAYPVVDYIVIVESATDFQWRQKPIYFNKTDPRFAPFADKIIHHVYGKAKMPKQFARRQWGMEIKARAESYYAVKHILKKWDWIIQSDTDEVIRREALQLLRDCVMPRSRVAFVMEHFYFGFQFDMGEWRLPIAAGYKGKEANDFLRPRSKPGNAPASIAQAGWHCAWCFPLSGIVNKINTFSHVELSNSLFRNKTYIEEALCAGRVFFRENHTLPLRPPFCMREDCLQQLLDLPAMVLRHAEQYWYTLPGHAGGTNCSTNVTG